MKLLTFVKCTALFVGCFFLSTELSATYANSQGIMQSKDKWISIEIRKYTEGTMQALLNELNTYENKVSSAVFNPENRTLTVYYAATLSYDDILQVVSRYYSDFTKTGGTELQ